MPEEIKCSATYWGGHFLHPSSKTGDSGNFVLTKDRIIFEKTALFSSNKWKIEIPIKKVLFKKISQSTGEDTAYKNKMTAMAYFAGKGPVSTFSRNVTFTVIPYKDEKGVEQNPKFSFGDSKKLEEILRVLYDKIKSK